MNKKIPIVIPSYEPDECLYTACKSLISEGMTHIIVVNDGSGEAYDSYFDAVEKELGVTVLVHEVNKGKGRALKTAFSYIIKEFPDSIGCVTADSDGQHTASDIAKCVETLMNNPDALVLGCRDFSGEDVPSKSRFGNELTKKICSYLCGIKVSDTQTGLRGIPLAFMKELLSVKGERFEFETYMLIESKEKYPIIEVEIQTVYDSKDDHKTHFDPIRDSLRIYKIFGKIFFKYLISSVSSCVLDLVLFSCFCWLFKGILPLFYAIVSTVLARLVSSTYNCLINYNLVFKSRKNLGRSMAGYFALAVIQMCLSAGLVTLGIILLPILPETLIKIIVDTVLFLFSYYIQNKYIF